MPRGRVAQDPLARLMTKVDRTESCWLWTGYVNEEGYGSILYDGKVRLVHRVAFTLMREPIPKGWVIDHLCSVRDCVNPAHLEAVSPKENAQRSKLPNRLKTHCIRGHIFDTENTYLTPTGARQCRSCRRIRLRESRANKRRGPLPQIDPSERFWSKVAKSDGCWLWAGFVGRSGYGKASWNGKTRSAHRIAYELMNGEIPEGMMVDHVLARGCVNRHCVNPAHLEAVTRIENMRRSRPAQRTHCPGGHPYTEENVYRYAGHSIMCKICKRKQANDFYQRRKEAHV